MQLHKAIISFAFVYALALYAQAGGTFSDDGFTTGTSVEDRALGALDVTLDDQGVNTGTNYWQAALPEGTSVVSGAVVTSYTETSPAYDYGAKGTTRNALFDKEPKGAPGLNLRYLALDLDGMLDRRIMPTSVETNVLVKTAAYDGLYADTLVKFTPSISAPNVDGPEESAGDKIVVWLRETETDSGLRTNLMVTAGRYAGSFREIAVADYAIVRPSVAADTWVRLTIRAISDVTGTKNGAGITLGEKAPGFTVYIDGEPVVGDATYDVGAGTLAREERLTPEARTLISERRLFPWIARAGYDRALKLTSVSFSGQGAVDDVSVSTERPGHVPAESVFTLKWDAGVKSMTCIVSNATEVVPYVIDATALPRYRDYALGTNRYARVTVENVVYDTALDYSNGVWTAENDCTVTDRTKTGGAFVYDGAAANPIGVVSSSRNVIGVGAGGFETFAEAKARAKESGSRTLALMSDLVIATYAGNPIFNDRGYLPIGPGEDFILDLNGHTLQGRGDKDATVSQTGGRLQITDSSDGQTGRILPPLTFNNNIAVRSHATKGKLPELILTAGWYDGEVSITGKDPTKVDPTRYRGTCIVEGGSYTNVDEAQTFYLEQYVTNTAQYFGLNAEDYWTTEAEGAFIWCGEGGSDTRWTTAANWKGRQVPSAGDLAIFPRREDASESWAVDFGEGVATKDFLMDADIEMAGTNEFSDVVVSGGGRLVGTGGVATFTGKLPGMLTANDEDSGEIRIGPAWRGTVRISNISKAKALADITGWGNFGSKVEFAGVRGYLSSKTGCALPYELVLTDDGDTPAWLNETGYTGSTVSFPKLTGAGLFKSPRYKTEILQEFAFRDVGDFFGRFDLGGKRLVLGTGVSASRKEGLVTFANEVCVRSGLGWRGVNAYFDQALYVQGETNDVLMTYTDTAAAPKVENVTVMLLGPDGTTNECSLALSGADIVVTNVVKKARRTLSANGKSVLAENVGGSVKSGETLEIPDGSAVAIVGNDVIVNGRIVSTVAEYYRMKAVGGDGNAFAVSLDESQVTPSLADFEMSSAAGVAVITVQNAKPGLWYGLRSISSLAEDWDGAPTTWLRADGDTVTFEPDATESSAFYQVVVTDCDPKGGAQ